jgi:hypothetical protein
VLYGSLITIDLILMLRYSRKQLPPVEPEEGAEQRIPAMQY